MWGHVPTCVCPICRSFARVFSVIHYGSSFEGFVQLVGDRARIFESEVRDLLTLVEGRNIVGLPSGAGVAPPVAVQPPPPRQVPEGEVRKTGEAASPKKERADPPGVVPKATPGVKFGSAEPEEFKEIRVKKEPSEEEEKPEKVFDKEKKPKDRKERREKKKKRSRSRKRNKSSEEKEGGGKKPHKKQRTECSEVDEDSEGRSKGEKDTPRKPDRKERKTREQGGGEADGGSGTASSSAWKPNQQSGQSDWHQSRGDRPQQGGKYPQGRGWQGNVPYSDHPRWREGKNKGITKRAKQERYHRRYPYDR